MGALACLHFTGIGWHIKQAEFLILVHCLIAAVLNCIELYFYIPEEHVLDHGHIPAHLVSEKQSSSSTADRFFKQRRERATKMAADNANTNPAAETMVIGGIKLKPKSPPRL